MTGRAGSGHRQESLGGECWGRPPAGCLAAVSTLSDAYLLKLILKEQSAAIWLRLLHTDMQGSTVYIMKDWEHTVGAKTKKK